MSSKLFLPETSSSQHVVSEARASRRRGGTSHNPHYIIIAAICGALEAANASSRGLIGHLMLAKAHPYSRALLQTCSASSKLSVTRGWEPCHYRAALNPNPGVTEDEIPTYALY